MFCLDLAEGFQPHQSPCKILQKTFSRFCRVQARMSLNLDSLSLLVAQSAQSTIAQLVQEDIESQ